MIENLQPIIDFISNNGFAIFCCCYMMINHNKSIKENTEILTSLKTLIEQKLQ